MPFSPYFLERLAFDIIWTSEDFNYNMCGSRHFSRKRGAEVILFVRGGGGGELFFRMEHNVTEENIRNIELYELFIWQRIHQTIQTINLLNIYYSDTNKYIYIQLHISLFVYPVIADNNMELVLRCIRSMAG